MALEYMELKKKAEEEQPFPTHIGVNDYTKQYLHTNRLTERIVPIVNIEQAQPPQTTVEESKPPKSGGQQAQQLKTTEEKTEEKITLSYNNPFTGTQTYHSEFYLLVHHDSVSDLDMTYGSVFSSGGKGVKHLLSTIVPKELKKTPVAEIEQAEKQLGKKASLQEIKTPLSSTQKELISAVIKAKQNQKHAIIVLNNYGEKIDEHIKQIKAIEKIENHEEQEKTFNKFLETLHKKDPILYHSISLVLKVFGESRVLASDQDKHKDKEMVALVNQTKIKQTETILTSVRKRIKGLVDIIKNSSIAELTKDLNALENFFKAVQQKKKEEKAV